MKISVADATALTGNFRDAGISQVNIPLAWRFDKSDLEHLVNASSGFIRFYAGLKTNAGGDFELTLLAVPTDTANDGDDIISGGSPEIYDFSTPCPVACDQSNSPLLPPMGSPDRVAQVFNRV